MILNFFCNSCFHKTEKLIGLKSKPEKNYFCEKCNYPLTRTLNAFSSNFIEKMTQALFEPFFWLLGNCGFNSDEIKSITAKLLENHELVYDAVKNETGNALELGLLDSQPAVKEALRSAISISSLLGTLGGVVVFGRDDELERES